MSVNEMVLKTRSKHEWLPRKRSKQITTLLTNLKPQKNTVITNSYQGDDLYTAQTTFNDVSVISWWSVLLVEKTRRKPLTCRKSLTNFIK